MIARKVIFWAHLAIGIVSGIVIAMMALTGTALAFEKELVAWSERDARQILAPAPGAKRIPLETLIAEVREQYPIGTPSLVTVSVDPTIATTIAYGRTNVYYVNPYSGQIRQPESRRMRNFMQVMFSWHRWLGRNDEQRETGKAITGACNLAFLGLAISGLYLWWPRHWTPKQIAARTLPTLKGHGKARDWNWHNALGFWTAPILIVLTATAIPISYSWGGDLINALTGSSATMSGGAPTAAPGTPSETSKLATRTSPLGLQAMIDAIEDEVPDWEQITYRIPGLENRRRGTPEALAASERAERRAKLAKATNEVVAKDLAAPLSSVNPFTFSVKVREARPRFASLQLTVDANSSSILRREGYADLDRARQVRSWTRFLHTGEALGPIGQLVAGLASLVAGVLVWTGFALSWRRFFGRRSATAPEKSATAIQ